MGFGQGEWKRRKIMQLDWVFSGRRSRGGVKGCGNLISLKFAKKKDA